MQFQDYSQRPSSPDEILSTQEGSSLWKRRQAKAQLAVISNDVKHDKPEEADAEPEPQKPDVPGVQNEAFPPLMGTPKIGSPQGFHLDTLEEVAEDREFRPEGEPDQSLGNVPAGKIRKSFTEKDLSSKIVPANDPDQVHDRLASGGCNEKRVQLVGRFCHNKLCARYGERVAFAFVSGSFFHCSEAECGAKMSKDRPSAHSDLEDGVRPHGGDPAVWNRDYQMPSWSRRRHIPRPHTAAGWGASGRVISSNRKNRSPHVISDAPRQDAPIEGDTPKLGRVRSSERSPSRVGSADTPNYTSFASTMRSGQPFASAKFTSMRSSSPSYASREFYTGVPAEVDIAAEIGEHFVRRAASTALETDGESNPHSVEYMSITTRALQSKEVRFDPNKRRSAGAIRLRNHKLLNRNQNPPEQPRPQTAPAPVGIDAVRWGQANKSTSRLCKAITAARPKSAIGWKEMQKEESWRGKDGAREASADGQAGCRLMWRSALYSSLPTQTRQAQANPQTAPSVKQESAIRWGRASPCVERAFDRMSAAHANGIGQAGVWNSHKRASHAFRKCRILPEYVEMARQLEEQRPPQTSTFHMDPSATDATDTAPCESHSAAHVPFRSENAPPVPERGASVPAAAAPSAREEEAEAGQLRRWRTPDGTQHVCERRRPKSAVLTRPHSALARAQDARVARPCSGGSSWKPRDMRQSLATQDDDDDDDEDGLLADARRLASDPPDSSVPPLRKAQSPHADGRRTEAAKKGADALWNPATERLPGGDAEQRAEERGGLGRFIFGDDGDWDLVAASEAGHSGVGEELQVDGDLEPAERGGCAEGHAPGAAPLRANGAEAIGVDGDVRSPSAGTEEKGGGGGGVRPPSGASWDGPDRSMRGLTEPSWQQPAEASAQIPLALTPKAAQQYTRRPGSRPATAHASTRDLGVGCRPSTAPLTRDHHVGFAEGPGFDALAQRLQCGQEPRAPANAGANEVGGSADALARPHTAHAEEEGHLLLRSALARRDPAGGRAAVAGGAGRVEAQEHAAPASATDIWFLGTNQSHPAHLLGELSFQARPGRETLFVSEALRFTRERAVDEMPLREWREALERTIASTEKEIYKHRVAVEAESVVELVEQRETSNLNWNAW